MTIDLSTSRLRLRPFRETDLKPLLAILGDAETMRWYPAPFDRDRVVSWISGNVESYERNGFGLVAIEDLETGELLGDVGPTIQDVDGEPHVELGWHVHRDRWGEGIATEAGVACRDWCWRNLDVDHLISLIRSQNRPSRKVAEKLGMSTWRESMRHDLPILVYRMERPE